MKTKLLMLILLSGIAIEISPKLSTGDIIWCFSCAIINGCCTVFFIIDVLWDIFKKKEE